jgi:hypothetical protein
VHVEAAVAEYLLLGIHRGRWHRHLERVSRAGPHIAICACEAPWPTPREDRRSSALFFGVCGRFGLT